MKPLISSFDRLTSQDRKSPLGRIIVSLLLTQDREADTGRHLMRIDSGDNGGSDSEETAEESTILEIGVIFSNQNSEVQ